MTAQRSCLCCPRLPDDGDVFADLASDSDGGPSDGDVAPDDPPAPWPRTLVTGVGPTSDADDFGEESFP